MHTDGKTEACQSQINIDLFEFRFTCKASCLSAVLWIVMSSAHRSPIGVEAINYPIEHDLLINQIRAQLGHMSDTRAHFHRAIA